MRRKQWQRIGVFAGALVSLSFVAMIIMSQSLDQTNAVVSGDGSISADKPAAGIRFNKMHPLLQSLGNHDDDVQRLASIVSGARNVTSEKSRNHENESSRPWFRAGKRNWSREHWLLAEKLRAESPSNGHIYLSLSAYRDRDCRNTLLSAFLHTDEPDKLFVGIHQEWDADKDRDCLDFEGFCDGDDMNPVCMRLDHITIERFDWHHAKGPVWGRHRSELFLGDQEFALQTDSHSAFQPHWDTELKEIWHGLDNEMAVMSTYPAGANREAYHPEGQEGTMVQNPVICRNKFSGKNLRHDAALEITLNCKDTVPLYTPFWGAGMSFSKAHRVKLVPYDCCLPMVFDGEEFTLGGRMWTHGYDIFSPPQKIIYHYYQRKKLPNAFWSLPNVHKIAHRSAQRMRSMLGLSVDASVEIDRTDYDKYNYGTVRPLSEYLRITGVDVKAERTYDRCEYVYSGRLHHDELGFYCAKERLDYDIKPFGCEKYGLQFCPDLPGLNNIQPPQ